MTLFSSGDRALPPSARSLLPPDGKPSGRFAALPPAAGLLLMLVCSGCAGRTWGAAGFGSVTIGGTAWGSPAIAATLGNHQNGNPGFIIGGPDSEKVQEALIKFLDSQYHVPKEKG